MEMQTEKEKVKLSGSALSSLCEELRKNNRIPPEKFQKYHVKRGLRNEDGTGVTAGLTLICNVHGYVLNEGERSPVPGMLTYRGYDIEMLVKGAQEDQRFGYEEIAWLLLFGKLPTAEQLHRFTEILSLYRELPENFVENMLVRMPSPDIMNQMSRAVLALYAEDENPGDLSDENVLLQSVNLLAKLPSIMAYAYQVKRRYYDNQSMVLHPNVPGLSTAEIILHSIRSDAAFTPEEAHVLDLCLMLHAEHGGGNNSTFATRVLSSSGTDTYAAISAAIGSLKGPRHGGANIKVMEMLEYCKAGIRDWEDDEEVAAFIKKLLHREAGDRTGLVYGMGHAVYTLSDPRATILKNCAYTLAEKKGFGGEFRLLEAIERVTPAVFEQERGENKPLCANVDMYSGLVYKTLGIDQDLFTPLFAVARMVGWCAHRMEEIRTGGRIIRPAYKSIAGEKPYIRLADR